MFILPILSGVLLIAFMICILGFMAGYDRQEHVCTQTAQKYGIASAILFPLSLLLTALPMLLIR